MTSDAEIPSLPGRIWLALVCLVRVIGDGEFAREVKLVRQRGAVPSGPIVEVGTIISSVLSASPVIPTPAAAPTPAELAAESARAATLAQSDKDRVP